MKIHFPLAVVQICVPDYRLGFFDALNSRSKRLTVFGGETDIEPTIHNAAMGQPWFARRTATFLANRQLAWVERKREDFSVGTVVIGSLNPRILSLWRDRRECHRLNIPYLLWGHAWGKHGPHGLSFQLRCQVASRADGVICYTESQAELMRKMVPHLPVIAAPNACLSQADCGVQGMESERDSVIYVGRLVVRKKVDLLIKGFAMARQTDPGFKGSIIIIGDGPERGNLTALAKNLGVESMVFWGGHEARVEKLREYYAKAYVSVSPGYVGLSLTQSFAFGVPALIARNEPHSPEIEAAREGINARFFESDSPEALGKAILATWREWRNIRSEREKLAAWTSKNYSFETMADRFVEMAVKVSGLSKTK